MEEQLTARLLLRATWAAGTEPAITVEARGESMGAGTSVKDQPGSPSNWTAASGGDEIVLRAA